MEAVVEPQPDAVNVLDVFALWKAFLLAAGGVGKPADLVFLGGPEHDPNEGVVDALHREACVHAEEHVGFLVADDDVHRDAAEPESDYVGFESLHHLQGAIPERDWLRHNSDHVGEEGDCFRHHWRSAIVPAESIQE